MTLIPFSDTTQKFLAREHRLFIGGRWVTGQSDRIIAVENPAREEIVAQVGAASPADLDAAVMAARAALDGPWSRMPPAERARLLFRLADLMQAHGRELAELSTIENGMPIWMSQSKMEGFCPDLIRYYAGWTTKFTGETLPAVSIRGEAEDWTVFTLKEPVGVVGAIIPWNAPGSMITLKTAPALAAGCTLVLKPAELTPLLATRFAELVEEAGFPAGVFNLVQGYGEDIGHAMAAHPGIDKIAFTGSTEVGKAIVRAASNDLKKVSLELGGKSPFIVCADADLDKAVPGAAAACFFLSGQNCMAGSRLFLEDSIADEFLAALAEVSRGYVVGDGMREGTLIGPVISARQRDRIRGFVSQAADEGATKLFEGQCPAGKGHFVAPTIFSDVTHDMRIARQEVFGPVLAVQRFSQDDEAELLSRVNGTEYGLSGSVWTGDISRALRLAKKVDSGQVGINAHAAISPETPFGGNKQSGWGREFGRDGLEAYFKTKAISINLGPHS